MRRRIVTFVLALAMVVALAAPLTACGWRGLVNMLPSFPVESSGSPSPSSEPSGSPPPSAEPSGSPSPSAEPSGSPPPSSGSSNSPSPSAGPSGSPPPSSGPSGNLPPSPTPSDGQPSRTPWTGRLTADVKLITNEHIVYITDIESGLFLPENSVTRGEAAAILLRLLSGTVPVTVHYSDVPASSPYAEAAGQLGSLGVIRPNENTFNGDEIISRGEFVSYIACFFPVRTDAEQFPDVPQDHPYAKAILSARAWGWLSGGSDGTFDPDGALHRYEVVAIINQALGRTGDPERIAEERPAFFLDVPPTKWYYNAVVEAAVPHTFTAGEDGKESWTDCNQTDTGLPKDFRTEGFHLYQGWRYYYSEKAQDIVRNSTVSGFTFDADGHFTSGDSWVDGELRKIVLSQTNSSMTQGEMLKAFFAYCRDTYKYLKWNTYDTGYTGFTLTAARQMLSNGRGNCYCYASVFWYLARWIGYDAKIFSGGVLGGPHSWVEIDGYIYDTQLEWRYVHDWGRTQYLWTFYHLKDTTDEFRYRK